MRFQIAVWNPPEWAMRTLAEDVGLRAFSQPDLGKLLDGLCEGNEVSEYTSLHHMA